ncbi:MAG: Hpt domain-containing protein [Bacteroidales bacterium]|nr:Hpt domain-containing protein [Bacteroidales bacterium]MBN2818327.1 Hpt domain-containing protein [Bacteroidales bacterium]
MKNMSAGNKELVLEMIDIFKNQVEEFNDEMESLNKNKEYEKLGKLAHKAKSSISIMGLHELATDLKTLENIAKAGTDVETYPKYIAKFREQTAEALEELDEVSKNIDLYI